MDALFGASERSWPSTQPTNTAAAAAWSTAADSVQEDAVPVDGFAGPTPFLPAGLFQTSPSAMGAFSGYSHGLVDTQPEYASDEEDDYGAFDSNKEWSAGLPPWGSEVFVAGLPKDVTESELRTFFERVGPLFQVRIPKDLLTGQCKGFAFVRFTNKDEAKAACKKFHQMEFRPGMFVNVVISEDNRTLFIGNLRKQWSKEHFERLMRSKFDSIAMVTIHSDPATPERNRGFAFVEFESHQVAGRALARMRRDDFNLEGIYVDVSWARPIREPDEEAMAQVKAVYVANLPEGVSEESVCELFKEYGPIDKVILASQIPSTKRRDFAFVHFAERDSALAAIERLNGHSISGHTLELSLRKPVERSVARVPRNDSFVGFGYKTKLCRYYMDGNCSKGQIDSCPFAHGDEELRAPPENMPLPHPPNRGRAMYPPGVAAPAPPASPGLSAAVQGAMQAGLVPAATAELQQPQQPQLMQPQQQPPQPQALPAVVPNGTGPAAAPLLPVGAAGARPMQQHAAPFSELVKRMAQKTRLCAFWEQGACAKGNTCNFAHGVDDLRREARFQALREQGVAAGGQQGSGYYDDPRPLFYKTKLCQFFEQGKCAKGDVCPFAHGQAELRGLRVPGTQPLGGKPRGPGFGVGPMRGRGRDEMEDMVDPQLLDPSFTPASAPSYRNAAMMSALDMGGIDPVMGDAFSRIGRSTTQQLLQQQQQQQHLQLQQQQQQLQLQQLEQQQQQLHQQQRLGAAFGALLQPEMGGVDPAAMGMGRVPNNPDTAAALSLAMNPLRLSDTNAEAGWEANGAQGVAQGAWGAAPGAKAGTNGFGGSGGFASGVMGGNYAGFGGGLMGMGGVMPMQRHMDWGMDQAPATSWVDGIVEGGGNTGA